MVIFATPMENSGKAWFEKWFDSPYYHILYKHRDEQEAVRFLTNLVKHTGMSGERAWDMACGKGRHAISLSSLGVDVIGSDISEQSILAAKQFEREKLSFYMHDMRMPIRVNYFDVVLNLFTSFGYFFSDRENEMVITSAYKSLKRSGIFVLDYLNRERVMKNLNPFEQKTIEGITFDIRKDISERNTVLKTIIFQADGRKYTYHEEVKLYGLEDISGMLVKTGFSVKETFGNYELEAFDGKSSDRLIIIAQK